MISGVLNTRYFYTYIFMCNLLRCAQRCFIMWDEFKKAERRTHTMKLQELLAGKQINWDRVKLIRHNLTKEEVAANYERGYLELYQSVQNRARFRDCDMVISFLGTEGTNGVFQGCYRVGSSKPAIQEKAVVDSVWIE